MRSKCAVAAFACLFAPATAGAADFGAYTPPPAQPFDTRAEPAYWSWRGFYIGANAGYAFGDNGFVEPEGFFGGGQAGYNWQSGRFLFGLEGDISGADIDDTARFGANTASTDVSWISTIRGRAGFVRDRTLLYATAGVAFADIERSFTGPGVSFRDSDVETGYVVGGGIEHALSDRWSTKLEYQYLNFDTGSAPFAADDLDLHTIRLGANYRF